MRLYQVPVVGAAVASAWVCVALLMSEVVRVKANFPVSVRNWRLKAEAWRPEMEAKVWVVARELRFTQAETEKGLAVLRMPAFALAKAVAEPLKLRAAE